MEHRASLTGENLSHDCLKSSGRKYDGEHEKVAEPVRRFTIKDIARAAGVSVSTVSHVLNDYGDISADTEMRVRQTIQEMDYHPSLAARRLVKKRSYVVELLMFADEGLRHPFFYEVTCGITAEVEEAGYELLMAVRDSRDQRWRETLRRCYESNVEGMIIMGTLPDRLVFDEVVASRIPTVFVDIPFEGPRATYVTSDNVGGARLATEHLISLGHRRIAFVDGYELADDELALQTISIARHRGYEEALSRHGIPFDQQLICYGNYAEEDARNVVGAVLKTCPDVTAVFATSDIMAIGAMSAVRDVGREVPGSVGVIGFDDIDAASLVQPALSTVKQQGEAMGRSAVSQLLRLMRNPDAEPEPIVLPVELVVRESC